MELINRMKQKSKMPAYLMIPALILMLGLTGCTMGPKIKDRIVFVHQTTRSGHNIEMAKILDGGKRLVFITKRGDVYAAKIPIKNMVAVRPDIAAARRLKVPRLAKNEVFKILREDGKIDYIDLGGWYLLAE